MREVSFQSENVVWPESPAGSIVNSSPLCLDRHRYFIKRSCDSLGVWDPFEPPACTFVQHYEFGQCPHRFIQLPNTSFCMLISSPETYYNDRQFQSIYELPTKDYNKLLQWLQDRDGDPLYWMPAIYEETVLYWRVSSRASDPWVTEFEISRISPTNDSIFVLANFSDSQKPEFYLEHWAMPHQRLLLYYEETTSLRSRICPSDWYGSRLIAGGNCFRITFTGYQTSHQPSINLHSYCSESRVFVIDSARKTHIFQELVSMLTDGSEQHYCLFNYDHTNDLHITPAVWEEASDRLSYVNWAENWQDEHGYLMIDSRTGKWSFRESYTCVVCEMVEAMDYPLTTLSFNESENAFSMLIRPSEFAWGTGYENPDILCMTLNSNGNTYSPIPIKVRETVRFPIQNQYTEGIYTIEPIVWNSKPTLYTCEIYDVSGFYYVPSSGVLGYHTANDIFAIIIKTDCADCNHLTIEYFLDMLNATESPHMDLITVVDAEMKLEYFSNDARHILYHLTVSLSAFYVSFEENRLGISDSDLRVYNLYQNLTKILTTKFSSEQFRFVSLNSSALCLPPSISRLHSTFNWLALPIGETGTPIEHYICSNGLPITRKCVGDHLFGAEWSSITNDGVDCEPASGPTAELLEILQNYDSPYQTKATLSKTYEIISFNCSHKFPLPIDVWTISGIMLRVNQLKPVLNMPEAILTLKIYSELMSIDEDILRRSSALNSTNELLHSLDIIVNGLELTKHDDGVEILRNRHLIVAIINPKIGNITGIGLFSNSILGSDDLGAYNLTSITKHQSSIDLLMNDELNIATYMSAALLDQLQAKHGQINRIVVVVFSGDCLFQSNSSDARPRADKLVISISVPQLDTRTLPQAVSTFFRSSTMNSYHNRDVCQYWNYTHKLGWDKTGMRLTGVYMQNVHCNAMHLTHFGHLMLHAQLSPTDDYILHIITIIGCSVSLLGIFIIFATAMKFPQWRSKSSSKFLLQFCGAITLQLLLFSISRFEWTSVMMCIALGSLHHYAVLLVFLWQLVIAYLQFMRYVVVLHAVGTDRWIRNVSLISWISPSLPVIVVLTVNPMTYVPDSQNITLMCYPQGDGLVFGLLLPIGVVTLANLSIFGFVFWNLLCKPKSEVAATGGVAELKIGYLQLRLFVLLFFLLGLSWLFGFIASVPGIGIVFAYLFCMTATIQGLMLFLYFIGLDPTVRRMWMMYFRHEFVCYYRRN